MLKENCTIRYASGCYWIVRASKNGGEYISPILTNETGYFIWKQLKNKLSADDISIKLAKKYNIPYEEALKDTDEFIQLIKHHGCMT